MMKQQEPPILVVLFFARLCEKDPGGIPWQPRHRKGDEQMFAKIFELDKKRRIGGFRGQHPLRYKKYVVI